MKSKKPKRVIFINKGNLNITSTTAKMRYSYLLLLLAIFLLPLVSASLTCTTNSISATTNYGIIPASQNISCTNSDVNYSVVLTQLGSFFSTNPSPVIIGAGEANKQIQISFSSQNVGTYTGYLSNISNPITITMTVNQQQSSTGCDIDIFPLALSNIKLKNGEKKMRNIQLSVPQCYPSYVNVQGISLQSDERPIQLSEISTGKITPGNNLVIPLEMDTTETVSTGTYNDVLSFLLYNSTGGKINVPSVSISVTVTTGISPISNYSGFTELPVCSLDAVEISTNSSHKFTCTIPNPNLQVHPIIDTKYIQGLSVQETSSQYIYEFKGVSIGSTKFMAEYTYKSASIGNPFSQDIRITTSGSSPLSGTELNFVFYQNGEKKEKNNLMSGTVTVLITDNKTNSIVPSFTLYLNGVQINNSFILEADRTYELRASSPGYIDGVSIIKVNAIPITIVIDPLKESYYEGDKITVTTVPEKANLVFDDLVATSPITLGTEGVHILKAVKEGYVSSNKNITVKLYVTVIDTSIPYDQWKTGNSIVLKISKPYDWRVTRDGVQIAYGNNTDLVKFKIDKVGDYVGTAGDSVFLSRSMENTNFFKELKWWHYLIGGILVVLVIYFLFIRDTSKKDSGSQAMSYEMVGR